MSKPGIEARTNSEVALTEALIPPAGLELSVEKSWRTSSTGFRVTWTDPTPVFEEFISKNFPSLEGSFPRGIVLKSCDKVPHIAIVNHGEIGESTLRMETEVDLRQWQHETRMPSCFGIAHGVYQATEGNQPVQVQLLRKPLEGCQQVVVMPRFPEDSSLVAGYRLGIIGEGNESDIASQLIGRLFSMRRGVSQEAAARYGSSQATLELIRDARMRRFERDSLFGDYAELVNQALEDLFDDSEMESLLLQEIAEGRIGEQHGDARPYDNLHFVLRKDGGVEAFIRDPVRLSMLVKGKPQLMETWFITHDDLQIGMMVGGCLPNSQHRWFVKSVVDAYYNWHLGNAAIYKDPARARLFGASLVYGLTVEQHVLNSTRYALSEVVEGRQGMENDSRVDPAIELDATVLKMQKNWEYLARLAESKFEGWMELYE
jgi:hypothetical protein